MPHEPYRLLADAESALAGLSDGQRAQFRAAATYHALHHPGADLEFRVTVGTPEQLPVVTGPATEAPASAVGSAGLIVRARSTAIGGPSGSEIQRRAIRLAHPDATPATTEPPVRPSLARRVYGLLERRAPMILDRIREAITERRARQIARPLPRFPEGPGDDEIVAALRLEAARLAPAVPESGPPAILFGLHWLQPSGAERWAIESIGIAQGLGFLPIVVTDHRSVHPWLTRPELEGAVVVTLSPDGDPELESALARALVANYRIRGAVVHHSTWLYRVLPLLKQWRPDMPTADSLHIVEYLGGGFPGLSARFDASLDVHHTISPELDRWLSAVQGIDPGKLAMAPLTGLTVDAIAEFRPRDPATPFTLVSVGRLSRQKRPEAFILLVRRLVRRGVHVRAIMHGDGELRGLTDQLIARYRLGHVIERRDETTPVAATLAEADLLVQASINEGLALTTIEAIAAGVPVLSTDVGSQRTLVPEELLVPRPVRLLIRASEARIARLAGSEEARAAAWSAQRARLDELTRRPAAQRFMRELFERW